MSTNNKNFPSTVYLDTNIIRRIGLTDQGTPFLELKKWAKQLKMQISVPQVVWMEWVNDIDTSVKRKATQTNDNLRDLQILIGTNPDNYELPKSYAGTLIGNLHNKLTEWEISIIRTPDNISLDELVMRATFKKRPFEEKGEKGFRDTIVLYTILEDMKSKSKRDGLFVTDDKIFAHQDVLEMVKKYKVNLKIASSLEEALVYIQNVLDDKVKRLFEFQKQKLLDFVKTKKQEVFEYIKKNAELTEDFITKGGFLSTKQDIYGRIEKVLEFEPFEIESAFDTKEYGENKEPPKNTQPILISVKTRLKIEYLPFLAFNQPTVKVSDLEKFREVVRSTTPRYYGDATEIELLRNITVSAYAIKNDKGEFGDLRLTRVNTF